MFYPCRYKNKIKERMNYLLFYHQTRNILGIAIINLKTLFQSNSCGKKSIIINVVSKQDACINLNSN